MKIKNSHIIQYVMIQVFKKYIFAIDYLFGFNEI